MYIRLHSEGMLTDVHNWLQYSSMVSKAYKGYDKNAAFGRLFLLAEQQRIQKDGPTGGMLTDENSENIVYKKQKGGAV